MPFPRSRDLSLAVGGVALVGVLSLAAVALSPPDDEGLPPGSSFSHGIDGTAAAFQALQQLGYSIGRSVEPVAALHEVPDATVLVLAGPSEESSEQDRRALQAFVARGGIVLATGCGGASFLTNGERPTNQAVAPRKAYTPILPSPLTAGATEIDMGPGCENPRFGVEYVSLYGDADDGVVRASRLGKGLAVWWAAATPITNDVIKERGNFDLLLNVLGRPGERMIVWDEYYHGQRRSIWSYAARTPLPWVGVQALVLGAAAAFAFARRRAPVRPAVVPPRTSPLEFVDTMAALYERAGAAAAAVATARTRIRRLLLDATGQTSSITDGRLASAAGSRLPLDEQDLFQLLVESDRAAGDLSLSAEEALPLVARLQAIGIRIDLGHRIGSVTT